MNTMPEFLKTREAENRVELLQEFVWSTQMDIKVMNDQIEKDLPRAVELWKLGAKAASTKVTRGIRDLRVKVSIKEKELEKLEAKLAELQ